MISAEKIPASESHTKETKKKRGGVWETKKTKEKMLIFS